MQVIVKGKQVDVGDSLRHHIESQLTFAAQKYFPNALEGHAVVTREAHLYRADVAVHVGRAIQVHGQASASDAYAAADQAIERAAKRLRRFKRRVVDNHRGAEIEPAPSYVLAPILPDAEPHHDFDHDHDGEANGAGEAPQPVIIAEMTTDIATLAVNEAVMRLDLGGLSVMLFRNAGHGGLNLVYRRTDGNIGWVDPQGNEQFDRLRHPAVAAKA